MEKQKFLGLPLAVFSEIRNLSLTLSAFSEELSKHHRSTIVTIELEGL